MIRDLPVRFFSYDPEADGEKGDFIEVNEAEFLNAEGVIEYERHTIFANGCAQICLTKNPFTNC